MTSTATQQYGTWIPSFGKERNKASQVVIKRNPCTIATWNVKILFATGILDNVVAEMERLKIYVLGLSDTQRPNKGKIKTKNGVTYSTGSTGNTYRYGVVIMVTKNINNSVINFFPYSDRIIMISLPTNNAIMNIIHMPKLQIKTIKRYKNFTPVWMKF